MKILLFLCCFGLNYEPCHAIECPICIHTAHKLYNVPQDIISRLGYNNNGTDFKCATNTKTSTEHCGPGSVSCYSRYLLYEGFGSATVYVGANVISEVVIRDCSKLPAQECVAITDPGMVIFTSFTGLSCLSASPKLFDLKIHEDDTIVNGPAFDLSFEIETHVNRTALNTGIVALPSCFALMYSLIPLLMILLI